MASSGKIFLCLAVLFCVVQAISARPSLEGSFLENVRYDLLKKCTGVEKDIEKESMNVKHKLQKESMKLLKKAIKEGSPECVEAAKTQAQEQLEEKTQEATECVQELKESLETELQPETGLQDIMVFRNEFKKKLQLCKNNGKAELKAIPKSFSAEGKACLV